MFGWTWKWQFTAMQKRDKARQMSHKYRVPLFEFLDISLFVIKGLTFKLNVKKMFHDQIPSQFRGGGGRSAKIPYQFPDLKNTFTLIFSLMGSKPELNVLLTETRLKRSEYYLKAIKQKSTWDQCTIPLTTQSKFDERPSNWSTVLGKETWGGGGGRGFI